MTQAEIDKERERKDGVEARISSSLPEWRARWAGMLDDTDERLMEYVEAVCGDVDGHNVYELCGVCRFFQLLERYAWDRLAVKNFFIFYEFLKFNGVHGRQRYRLTPVQCFQFASMLGFRDADGRRLVRLAYIFVPRKFSKTTSAASLAVYDMLFGDSNAQAYIGANSYEQAKICFDEISAIMRGLDPSESSFRVNREKISYKVSGRDSLIRCLTANAKTQDGLNASLVILDEYAQARNTAGKNGADLKNVLTSSMGARREPLTVIITTASDVLDGPFAHEMEGVKKVLLGEEENDGMFASVFQPDAWDRDDDPRTWAKVQPHLGVTVQPDFYAREWETAKLSAENMLAFRTKLLNVFTVNERKTWFTYEKARELLGSFDIDSVTDRPSCAVSFDLSVHDDFSAVSYMIYRRATHKFYCHTDYYFPRGALAGHPNEDLYRRWHDDGYLRLCEGDIIDPMQIARDIMARAKNLSIFRVGYDSYKSRDLVNMLYNNGGSGVVMAYSQTYGSFNMPVEAFEMLAWGDPPKIEFNGNPINAYCLANCIIDEDRMENKKPIKVSHYRKIDGAITCLMCIGMMQQAER